MSGEYNDSYINELEAFFIARNDIINRWGNIISSYQLLPGLVGFWPMATVQRSTGNVPNYAPFYTGASSQDLAYNGNPKFNFLDTGVPYIDLDGTGDYLSVSDNTDLRIQGNEGHYANPGLTMVGWLYPEGSGQTAFGKTNDTAGPYWLFNESATNWLFRVRNNTDTTNFDVRAIGLLQPNTWQYVACRFTPSTELAIWRNTTKTTNTTSIPASLWNGTDAFAIGANGVGASNFTGNITLVAICASALSDAIILQLFQQTRVLFGV